MIDGQDRAGEGRSRLADNILMFFRTLRSAGLPIGPGRVLEAMSAIRHAGIERRDEFYWALRAVLVNNPAEFRLFDQAFHIYFRNPRLLERVMSLLIPALDRTPPDENRARPLRRLLEALSVADDAWQETAPTIETDRSGSSSRRELLRRKDFEDMSSEEFRDAKDLLRDELIALTDVPTRRFRPHALGERFDLRRSMRLMLKNNGELVELARKRQIRQPPPLVLIGDVSGSMSRYSRVFLYFAHVMGTRQRRVSTFVFGTRLTNITRRLADPDVDRALAAVANDVRDWDGGTRIGECLQTFNADWGRRVLAQNASILLFCDGLERDSKADLSFQMQRLRRTCRRLIWINPMLRYSGFEPKAFGIRTMLPHVDSFLPAHNVQSLTDLAGLLRRDPGGARTAARLAEFRSAS